MGREDDRMKILMQGERERGMKRIADDEELEDRIAKENIAER